MRLFWVEKVSSEIIEKIRKEIGDLFYIDIDTGISAENLALLEKHYVHNNINVNTFLKKAIRCLAIKKCWVIQKSK